MQREQYLENKDSKKLLKTKMIKNNLFKEYFEYSSPSNMYKNLNTTTDIEENKTKVNKIKDYLSDWMMKFKQNPTNNAKKKNRNRNNVVEIVELILKFNQLEQERSGLKI